MRCGREIESVSSLRSWLAPPRSGDPRQTLRWIRRMQIVMGVGGLIAAALTWTGEWSSWLILGGSLLSLSPWSGARAILRKADKRPEILVTDRAQRRRRARRTVRLLVPTYLVIFTIVGYVSGGAI